jgi:hypothetical protein
MRDRTFSSSDILVVKVSMIQISLEYRLWWRIIYSHVRLYLHPHTTINCFMMAVIDPACLKAPFYTTQGQMRSLNCAPHLSVCVTESLWRLRKGRGSGDKIYTVCFFHPSLSHFVTFTHMMLRAALATTARTSVVRTAAVARPMGMSPKKLCAIIPLSFFLSLSLRCSHVLCPWWRRILRSHGWTLR